MQTQLCWVDHSVGVLGVLGTPKWNEGQRTWKHPFFLISAWLTTIVSLRKSSLSLHKNVRESQPACNQPFRCIREGDKGGHFGEFPKPLSLRVFHQVNFSNVTNFFVAVIVIPLNPINRVSFAFLASEVTVTVTKLISILDGTCDVST